MFNISWFEKLHFYFNIFTRSKASSREWLLSIVVISPCRGIVRCVPLLICTSGGNINLSGTLWAWKLDATSPYKTGVPRCSKTHSVIAFLIYISTTKADMHYKLSVCAFEFVYYNCVIRFLFPTIIQIYLHGFWLFNLYSFFFGFLSSFLKVC